MISIFKSGVSKRGWQLRVQVSHQRNHSQIDANSDALLAFAIGIFRESQALYRSARDRLRVQAHLLHG